jgi:hypothetical protein
VIAYSAIHDVTQLLLICIGFYVVVWSTGNSFFARERGRVLEIALPPNCRADSRAATILVHVELEDGTIEKAEMSPCTACMERIKKGDVVALMRSGDRLIAQKGVSWCL